MEIPFDLKICKLTGYNWNRGDLRQLAIQLLEKQGEYRKSVENRIVVIFDWSKTSSTKFLRANKQLLHDKLLEVVLNFDEHCLWIDKFECWQCIILIRPDEYEPDETYYEHSIGSGLRERGKAIFEDELLREVAAESNGLLRVNPNHKEHGVDGWIKK